MARTNHISPQESQWIISSDGEYGRSEWILNQSSSSQVSSNAARSVKSSLTFADIDLKDTDTQENSMKRRQAKPVPYYKISQLSISFFILYRLTAFFQSIRCTSCSSIIGQGCILGVLLGSIVLAIVLIIWLTSNKATATTAITAAAVQITSSI